MKRQFKNSMYDVDPVTGKLTLLPLQWSSPQGPGSSIKKKKKSTDKKKRFTELKPLRLTDFEEPAPRVKKTDSVRKGLFTRPQVKKNQPSRISFPRRNSEAKNNSTVKAPVSKQNPPSSPLLNMEEVEEELLSKKASLRGYPFKSPTRPYFKFSASKSKPLNIPQIIIEEQNQSDKSEDVPMVQKEQEPKTPDFQSSSEFLKLESMCRDSPVSSMCTLLEDTGLNSIKRPKPISSTRVDIESMLGSFEDILKSEQTAFKQYTETHEQNMLKLQNVIASLKRQIPSKSNKENSPLPNHRRSTRLQNRSPLSKDDKLLVSPGIQRSGDLRKSTLKKNLAARNKEYPNQSCRTPKPIELFKKQSILETPKTDRKCLFVGESPGMRYVSMMVENQRLMLQETPVHK